MEKKDLYHFTMYIERDLAGKFRAKAFKDGRKMADIVRELIRLYLKGSLGV